MKRLSFSYCLTIRTVPQVKSHYFRLMCCPLSDSRQEIFSLQTSISPADFVQNSTDEWGNGILYGSCTTPHDHFTAAVSGEAAAGMQIAVPSADPRMERIFRYPTELTLPDNALADFARFTKIEGLSPLRQAETVMEAVYDRLRYAPGITSVNTAAAEAFRLGGGVCQDYAHIMLSVLRCQGIAARYTAGMLLGEGKSHAWVEVLEDGYWYGFDPTNRKTVTDEHITLCRGRDYRDCTINKGIFRGFADQKTEHSVIVKEIL